MVRALLTNMKTAVATLDRREANPIPAAGALVVTRDGEVLRTVTLAAGSAPIEVRFDGFSASRALRSRPFALVVIDDEALTESERAWLIDDTHRWQAGIPVVYVAANHSPEVERTARIHGVVCYTAKPVDAERLMPVVARALHRTRSAAEWRAR